jgi:hypothetical protein
MDQGLMTETAPCLRFGYFRIGISDLFVIWCLVLGASVGCSSQPKLAQLSGKITFKGQPVPAGYISFAPDVASGNKGQLKVFQIKDGAYDSAKEDPPGLPAGHYFIRIAGFDGKRIPMYGQGKQIFNEVTELEHTVPDGSSTKDFAIPDSAGQNVQIRPTADT